MEGCYFVLFLCTGNSARSLLAECLLAKYGGERFGAFSAGSHPLGAPHPNALEILTRKGHSTDHLQSKSWDNFTQSGAPTFDFVFTVCDRARDESCPVWPGAPFRVHWGLADPVAWDGDEARIRAAFERTYQELEARIRRFVALDFENLEREALKRTLDELGRSGSG
ncbi:MAG: arsenate reductase ArsC [Myxococcota bacterium]|nr:arsenate reductase ArsC [Myxococcota bacterium]